MSREIDERIVAMYFDNKNFEKGARETLNTLDELKKSMSMEGLGKGFDAFEQASKKLNFDKLTSGIGKFKSALSTVGSSLSKAFDISILNNFENKLRSFKNDYFDRLIGFDIAGKLEQSLLNAFRGFAIEPIQMGYKQYESMMDSTKTIMNSTGESLDVVNAKLQQMTDYANQTIYSLTDMTSNLGKFTNNGIALNDATDAMIGLTNATAKAGQGAQQASMAMYNVSQAIGVGKMTSIDWKSLENANVATKELKETFIAAAVANGQLTKKMEKNAKTGQMEAKYYTKAEKGVKSVQVSYENFRETLSSGWLDKDTMMDTFKIFSNQLSVEGIMALGNYTREEAEELYKLGESAMAAAKEVRTFGKMMDALKESTQSGWAKSFEYIFGDVDESTSLWTTINDKIDAMLTAGTEERNNVLMAWRGLMKDENGNVKKIEDVYNQRLKSLNHDYDVGNISTEEYQRQREELEKYLGNRDMWVDYRSVAVESLTDLIDVVRDIAGQIKAALSDVFGAFDGNGLKTITVAFKSFVDRVKGWLGTADDVNSNLSKIRKAFVVVFTALKLVVAYYKTKVQVILAVARPILEAVLDILARIGEWLTDIVSAKNIGEGLQKIGQKFKDLWKTLSSLGFVGVLDKIGVAFGDFVVSIFSSLGGFLDGIGLGGVTQFFVDFFDSLKEGWNTITGKISDWWNSTVATWPLWNTIGTFFTGVWDKITGIFKGQKKRVATEGLNGREWVETEENSPFVQFFVDAWEGIKNFFEEVKGWPIWNEIGKFFSDTWSAITGIFKGKTKRVATEGLNGREWVETSENSPFVQFFIDAWEGIKDFFEEVANWDVWQNIGKFFTDIWDKITGVFKGQTKRVATEGLNGREWIETKENSPFVQFFTDAWEGIKSFFEEVENWPVWQNIGKFFTDVWDKITGIFKGKTKRTRTEGLNGREWVETTENSPFVQFFVDAWEGIKHFFETVTGWPVWQNIGKFFTDVWDKITGVFKGRTKRVATEGLNGREWVETSENSPFVQFFTDAWEGIKSFFDSVIKWPVWKNVGQFFANTWDSIIGIFKGNTKRVAETGLNGREWVEVEERSPFVQFFVDAWEGIRNFWDDGTEASVVNWPIWKEIGNFFSDLWESITGVFKGQTKRVADTGLNGREWIEIQEEPPVVSFFKGVWEGIQSVWGDIVGWDGWAAIGKFFTDTWGWIVGLFKGDKGSTGGAEVSESTKEAQDTAESMNDLVEACKDIGALGADPEVQKIFEEEGKKSVVQQIGEFFAGIFANITDFVKEVGKIPGADKLIEIVEKALAAIEGILNVILDWIARVTGTAVDENGNKIEMRFSDWVLPALGAIAYIILQITKAKQTTGLAKLSEKNLEFSDFGTKMLKIAAAIGIIALSLGVLSAIPEKDLTKAAISLVVIGAVIAGIVVLIKKLTDSKTGLASIENAGKDAPVTGIERVVGRIITAISAYFMLSMVLDKLPKILEAIAKAKNISSEFSGIDVMETMIGIVALIGGIVAITGLLSKMNIGVEGVKAAFAGAVAVITVFMTLYFGFAALFEAGSLLADAAAGGSAEAIVKRMQKGAEVVSSVIGGIGTVIGSFFGNLFKFGAKEKTAEQEVEESKAALDLLNEYGKAFDTEAVTGMVRVLDIIQRLGDDAAKIDPDKMSRFADASGSVATAVATFAETILKLEDMGLGQLEDVNSDAYKKLESRVAMMKHITEIMAPLAGFGTGANFRTLTDAFIDFVMKEGEFEDETGKTFGTKSQLFAEAMEQVINDLGGLSDGSNVEFNGIDIVTKLFESIQNVLNDPEGHNIPKFNALPITDALIEAIAASDSALAIAVHNLLQHGFDLVGTKQSLGFGDLLDGATLTDVFSMLKEGNAPQELLDYFNQGGEAQGTDYIMQLLGVSPDMLQTKLGLAGEENGETFIDSFTNKLLESLGVDNQEGLAGALSNLSLDWDLSSLTATDENGNLKVMNEITSQWGQIQSMIEESEDFVIAVRPIIDMTGLGEEASKMRSYFAQEMPLLIGGEVNLGEQAIAINDSGIVNELRYIRDEIASVRTDMNSTVENLRVSIGNDLNGLGNDIARLKVYLDRNRLVGWLTEDIDKALYNVGNNAKFTGVPTYVINP